MGSDIWPLVSTTVNTISCCTMDTCCILYTSFTNWTVFAPWRWRCTRCAHITSLAITAVVTRIFQSWAAFLAGICSWTICMIYNIEMLFKDINTEKLSTYSRRIKIWLPASLFSNASRSVGNCRSFRLSHSTVLSVEVNATATQSKSTRAIVFSPLLFSFWVNYSWKKTIYNSFVGSNWSSIRYVYVYVCVVLLF